MQESLHGFLHGIKWMDHVSWSLEMFSKNQLLEVGLTQNQETRTLRNLTTVDLLYFLSSVRNMHKYKFIEITFWLRGRVTYDLIIWGHLRCGHFRVRDHAAWFWKCLGTAFGHPLWGSHNFMVTALFSSCEKWPWGRFKTHTLISSFTTTPNSITTQFHKICQYQIPQAEHTCESGLS